LRLRPASSPSQVGRVPTPSGDTSPTPVTSTRRRSVLGMISRTALPRCVAGSGSVLLAGVLLDVGDRLRDAPDLLGILVGDLDAELLLESHHELDDVERIGSEIVGEAGIGRDFVGLHAQLLDDDALDLLGYGRHVMHSSLKGDPWAGPRDF